MEQRDVNNWWQNLCFRRNYPWKLT